MSAKLSFITLFVLMNLTGCTSFSSTILNRLGDNSFVGNSNGKTKMGEKARPYKGVPVTLKVPTHLDISIMETYYLQKNAKQRTLIEVTGTAGRLLDIDTEIVKSDKVFMVDFKRPGAGILDLSLTFDEEEQYFSKIESKLEDRTIQEAADLIGTTLSEIQQLFPTSSAPTPEEKSLIEKNGLIRDKRVIAYRRFDINDPDFELQVEAFVNDYLNSCHRCDLSADPTQETTTATVTMPKL